MKNLQFIVTDSPIKRGPLGRCVDRLQRPPCTDAIVRIFGQLHLRGSHGVRNAAARRAERKLLARYHCVDKMVDLGIKKERL